MTIEKPCKLTINTTRSDSPAVINLVNGEVDITISADNSIEIRVRDDNGGLFWKIGVPVKKEFPTPPPPTPGMTRSAQELLKLCEGMSRWMEYAYMTDDGVVGVRTNDLDREYIQVARSGRTPTMRPFYDALDELKGAGLVDEVVSDGGVVVVLTDTGEVSS